MYELAPGVHVERCEIRFYGFRLETRMAVVLLPGGELLLYSPVWLSEKLRGELDHLGRVAFILSPNKIHNQTLPQYRAAYPTAAIFAPPGLPSRRPDIEFSAVLAAEPRPEWSGVLDQALTQGNVFFSEVLLFHRHSRTLLVADLVENIASSTTSRFAYLLCWPFGIRKRPMPSPEFRLYTHDADAARHSLAKARDWPIERIFLCHGELIDRDAKAVFETVCEELVAGASSHRHTAKRVLRALAALQ